MFIIEYIISFQRFRHNVAVSPQMKQPIRPKTAARSQPNPHHLEHLVSRIPEPPRWTSSPPSWKSNKRTKDTGGFPKWWYPTTMSFPTKNDHFGVFWGYHHLRKHPYTSWWLNQPIWKILGPEWESSPGSENKNYLNPSPRYKNTWIKRN